MSFGNRGKMETIYEILKRLPLIKTHIMYKVNLSHQNMERYLEYLIRRNLVVKDGKFYYRTVEGDTAMNRIHEALVCINPRYVVAVDLTAVHR
jgi:predicted transcriptional regulator